VGLDTFTQRFVLIQTSEFCIIFGRMEKAVKEILQLKILKTALVLNAASCIVFGLLFIVMGSSVNDFIGNQFVWLTPIVGVALVFNGCHLLFASQRKHPICPEILYFIAGDVVWVVASLVFIGLGLVVTTELGAAAGLTVAVMVGFFAVLQVVGYRQTCTVS